MAERSAGITCQTMHTPCLQTCAPTRQKPGSSDEAEAATDTLMSSTHYFSLSLYVSVAHCRPALCVQAVVNLLFDYELSSY